MLNDNRFEWLESNKIPSMIIHTQYEESLLNILLFSNIV